DRLSEREVLDALSRPERVNLGARNPPHLLGVRAEERLVETTPEPRRDPLLESLRFVVTVPGRAQIGERTARGFPKTEPADDVFGGDRIGEVLAVVVDPGESRSQQELIAEHSLPQGRDRLELREEAVTAEVEAVAVELDRLRDPPDGAVGLEDRRGLSSPAEDVGSAQTSGPGTEDCRADAVAVLRGRPLLASEDLDPRLKGLVEWARPVGAEERRHPAVTQRAIDGLDRLDHVEPDLDGRDDGTSVEDRCAEVGELERE